MHMANVLKQTKFLLKLGCLSELFYQPVFISFITAPFSRIFQLQFHNSAVRIADIAGHCEWGLKEVLS